MFNKSLIVVLTALCVGLSATGSAVAGRRNYYNYPTSGYYAPTSGYYAPTSGYYAPTSGYYAPTSGYYAPTSGYYGSTAGYYGPTAGGGGAQSAGFFSSLFPFMFQTGLPILQNMFGNVPVQNTNIKDIIQAVLDGLKGQQTDNSSLLTAKKEPSDSTPPQQLIQATAARADAVLKKLGVAIPTYNLDQTSPTNPQVTTQPNTTLTDATDPPPSTPPLVSPPGVSASAATAAARAAGILPQARPRTDFGTLGGVNAATPAPVKPPAP